MKKLLLSLLAITCFSTAYAAVEYRITYDAGTQKYTVSVRSSVAYTGANARITSSTQITVVAPDTDGTGPLNFTVTNLTSAPGTNNLTWSLSQLNSPSQNTGKDYLFFAPANSGAYTTFDFPLNTWVDLFTFQTSSSCNGVLYCYDNSANTTAEPMNGQTTYNTKNNFKTLGGGNVNLWAANFGGSADCNACAAEAGTLGY